MRLCTIRKTAGCGQGGKGQLLTVHLLMVAALVAQLCSHGDGAVSLALAGSFGYPAIAAVSAGLGLLGTGAVWLFQRRPVAATA